LGSCSCDILIFSQTLEEHLSHLQKLIRRLTEVGLKLKPTKCQFACTELKPTKYQFARTEVEHLGLPITPNGLKTNTRLVEAVREFPPPQSIQEVC